MIQTGTPSKCMLAAKAARAVWSTIGSVPRTSRQRWRIASRRGRTVSWVTGCMAVEAATPFSTDGTTAARGWAMGSTLREGRVMLTGRYSRSITLVMEAAWTVAPVDGPWGRNAARVVKELKSFVGMMLLLVVEALPSTGWNSTGGILPSSSAGSPALGSTAQSL